MTDKVTKVLLIDDDKEDFIIARQMLAQISEGQYELEWLSNFEEASQAIARGKHDVYLIDYVLGLESGLDLVKEAIQAGHKKPMIILTAQGNTSIDMEAIQIGAADYLPKSELSPAFLERTIRHAIERHQLLERLYYQATHDELTGLYNRKYINQQLASMTAAASRHNFPLSLCLCDLDCFKEINDTYGHNSGDKVLSTFGEILTKELRAEDIPGRYGGDEFCIIYPYISPTEAKKCTERIRESIHKYRFVTDSGKEFSISATFGITSFKVDYSPKKLLALADQALYKAKRSGRNRTVSDFN